MIGALILAGGLALPGAPAQDPGGFFAPPRIFTFSFEEAMKTPVLRAPERLALDLRSPRPTAHHPWTRFLLGGLANDSFEAWERDPGAARRAKGQPSWAWTRFPPPSP